MKISSRVAAIAICAAGLALQAFAADSLPSWNDGAAKRGIIDFVEKVTKEGSPDFVPPTARIATFDNDGTLWCEQPLPVQLYFALDRVKALAPRHPEWKTKEPFASLLKGDVKGALAGGDLRSRTEHLEIRHHRPGKRVWHSLLGRVARRRSGRTGNATSGFR